MLKKMRNLVGWLGVLMITVAGCWQSQAWAAETKIGVLDMQKVLATSSAGQKAQELIEQRMESLQTDFRKQEGDLLNLQSEIERRSSAWSDTVRQEKAMEFQQKRRDLLEKQEEAKMELQKLQEKHVNPILQKLEGVVEKVAKEKGYALILPRNIVLHASPEVDISDLVVTELNKVLK
ncbi:OmpH family outer membrane protein [Desulfobulbus alkaliphilus]|uniref:OmpH family outer membrane protein n=1 Tax=Desulfobulbus alkaliphilus TaxID=869814 RepID=UPI0019656E92|nr:OmpH family outer membrane protein [Desulfobulbus alkaliphilus]MBM9537346.1 OmpH family outer membrane protein [Desulfobulbus alkaliphilus]